MGRGIQIALSLACLVAVSSCWRDPEDDPSNKRRRFTHTEPDEQRDQQKSGENEGKTTDPTPPPETSPEPESSDEEGDADAKAKAQRALMLKALTGEWEIAECLPIEGGRSSRVRSEFLAKQKANWSIEVFKAGDCTGSLLTATTRVTYELKAALDQAGAYQIDYTVQSAAITTGTLSPFDRILLRSMKFCGVNDWGSNVERDVTGRTCKLIGGPEPRDITFPERNTVIYDIVQVVGDELKTGLSRKETEAVGGVGSADVPGSRAELRPDAFQETFVRIKAKAN